MGRVLGTMSIQGAISEDISAITAILGCIIWDLGGDDQVASGWL